MGAGAGGVFFCGNLRRAWSFLWNSSDLVFRFFLSCLIIRPRFSKRGEFLLQFRPRPPHTRSSETGYNTSFFGHVGSEVTWRGHVESKFNSITRHVSGVVDRTPWYLSLISWTFHTAKIAVVVSRSIYESMISLLIMVYSYQCVQRCRCVQRCKGVQFLFKLQQLACMTWALVLACWQDQIPTLIYTYTMIIQ